MINKTLLNTDKGITLFKGNCLEKLKFVKNQSVDLVLCDLPYGTTGCKWDSIIDLNSLWKEYERVLKYHGSVVLFSAQPFTTKLINSNFKNYRYSWIWLKNNVTGFCFAKWQPMRQYEEICVFAFNKNKNTKLIYNPQGLKPTTVKIRKTRKPTEIYRQGLNKTTIQQWTNYPRNVLKFNKEPKSLHPTQKPVALLEYLIKTYTNDGMTVLDNTMGSGSTGVACINTNRNFIGIELEEKYFNIAKERIEQSLNEKLINCDNSVFFNRCN